jgi:hypothetical protein
VKRVKGCSSQSEGEGRVGEGEGGDAPPDSRRIFLKKYSTSFGSSEKIPAVRPYSVSLAILKASSSVLNLATRSIGRKSSSFQSLWLRGRSAIIVGWT